MREASDELLRQSGDSAEPYRVLLSPLRQRLRATREWARAAIEHGQPAPAEVLQDCAELRRPLELCYRSLHACGMGLSPTALCSTACVAWPCSACSPCGWTFAVMRPVMPPRWRKSPITSG